MTDFDRDDELTAANDRLRGQDEGHDPEHTVRNFAPVAPSYEPRGAYGQTNGNGPQPRAGGAQTPAPHDNFVRNVNMAPPPPPPSAARERMIRRRTQRSRGGEWAWVVIAVALIGASMMISLTLFVSLRFSQANENDPVGTAVADLGPLPTPVDFRVQGDVVSVGQTIAFEDGTEIALTPWDGESRVTILLMGLDRRPGERGLTYRTDTMLVLSLDPATDEIGILSIPRDLWVNVPGYSQLRRINEPMVLGEIRQPGYGPILAMETVQHNLGIRVNHYALVDFQAFIQIVDAVGGIEVDVPYNISDPRYPSMYYGYDPFYIRAGRQLLNGDLALKFARTRHGDNDIRRGERQRMVLFALRDRVLQSDLTELLGRAPSILAALRDKFYTDLSLEQMISLGLYVKDVPPENIRTGGIGWGQVYSWTTPQGAQVLVPNRSSVANLMEEVFGPNYSQ